MSEFNVDALDDLENFCYTRSIKLIEAIQKNRDYKFCGAKSLKISDDLQLEILIVTLTCDGVPDENPFGINYREKLGIVVNSENNSVPEVWTLRNDFPCLSHMNDRLESMPNSLCLYFENEVVTNRTWTAEKFLKRIYWWMELSARGELHASDQPLEQFFFNSQYELVLPKECGENLENISGDFCISRSVSRSNGACTFFVGLNERKNTDKIPAHIICLEFPPVVTKTITPTPKTLSELNEHMAVTGLSANELLKEYIQSLVTSVGYKKTSDERKTIIIIKVPIIRNAGGEVERVELKAFLTTASPFEIGEKSGFLVKSPHDGKLYKSTNLLGGDDTPTEDVELFQVEVFKMNSKDNFREQSGFASSGGKNVLIGLGALGSILLDLWSRGGWGEWTLIDKDHIKPHNLTRHTASKWLVGWNKAVACATLIENTTDITEGLKVVEKDVMSKDQEINDILSHTELVVDVTTTLDYPRLASFKDEYSRHCSLFITPQGNDSVLLLEDKSRAHRLRSLEAQYYRAILNSDWGNEHLRGHLGKFISGASCRDISFRLPFSSVMSHAATLCEQVMRLSEKSEAKILIWKRDKDTGAVEMIDCPVFEENDYSIGGHQVFIDNGLKKKLNTMRNENLPSETGGILLGYHDLNLNAVFIVDALPAPSDSTSSEVEFQRGTQDTLDELYKARDKTANIIDYIGEWHSHPKHATSSPSGDDIVQLVGLSKLLAEDGLPAIQLIVGGNDINIIIGEVGDV